MESATWNRVVVSHETETEAQEARGLRAHGYFGVRRDELFDRSNRDVSHKRVDTYHLSATAYKSVALHVAERPANHHQICRRQSADTVRNDPFNLMIHRIEGGNHEEDIYKWNQTQEEPT